MNRQQRRAAERAAQRDRLNRLVAAESIQYRLPDGRLESGVSTDRLPHILLHVARTEREPSRGKAREWLANLFNVPSFDDVERLASEHGDAWVIEQATAALNVAVDAAVGGGGTN